MGYDEMWTKVVEALKMPELLDDDAGDSEDAEIVGTAIQDVMDGDVMTESPSGAPLEDWRLYKRAVKAAKKLMPPDDWEGPPQPEYSEYDQEALDEMEQGR